MQPTPARPPRPHASASAAHAPFAASSIKTLRRVNATKGFELLREKRVSMRFLARDRSNSRDGRRCVIYPMIATSAGFVIREHRIPTAKARPYIVTLGPDGNVWFCESGADRIGRLSTRDYTTAEFPLPHCDSVPIGIIAGADGNLWFTQSAGHRIGLDGLRLAQRPPSFACLGQQLGRMALRAVQTATSGSLEQTSIRWGASRRRAKSLNIRRASPQWDSVIRPPLVGRA
jgi:hypothetical protein